MLFIAIANGALRQFTFGRVMTELRAHQLSTLIYSDGIHLIHPMNQQKSISWNIKPCFQTLEVKSLSFFNSERGMINRHRKVGFGKVSEQCDDV